MIAFLSLKKNDENNHFSILHYFYIIFYILSHYFENKMIRSKDHR